MVNSWVVAVEEQPQPQTELNNLSTAESVLLPRSRAVLFPKTDRFPHRDGAVTTAVSALRDPPAPKAPTIKFGVPPPRRPPTEDTREPMTIKRAEQCFEAVQHCSPRFTMGGTLVSTRGTQVPGPGSYNVERAADAASPSRPQGRFRGKGIASFSSKTTSPRLHSKDTRPMPGLWRGLYVYCSTLLTQSFVSMH